MQTVSFKNLSVKPLSESAFQKLKLLIQSRLGLKMPDEKRCMLESRLQKRICALHLDSLDRYCRYLFSKEGMQAELPHFVDVVTTHKTDFFRESPQFDVLSSAVVPGLIAAAGIGIKRRLCLWSAGCATGEEAYSLAIVLHELKTRIPDFNFSILASDVSAQALEWARLAVYQEQFMAMIPENLKKRYFLRSKEHTRQLVRVVPLLRNMIDFRKINLMNNQFRLPQKMDVIFCRNVLIYFSRSTQETLIRKFHASLRTGGYLFLGHTENLCGMTIPLVPVAPNVYRACAK